MNGAAIQVAVRSPDRLLREALAAWLGTRPGVNVVGATSALGDLTELCRLRRTDVALVEVTAPYRAEIEHIAQLRAIRPDLNIVLVYDELSAEEVVAAGRAGVTTLVPHARGLEAVVASVVERPAAPARPRPGMPVLTDRDMEILALMSAGYSVGEISGLLGIAMSTVENHKRRIFAKLDVHSQTHALARAARLGLLWSAAAVRALASRTAPGTVRMVVVRGPDSPLRDTVARALMAHRLPVLVSGASPPAEEDIALQVGGPVVFVLIDATATDWQVVQTLGARAVVVTQSEPDQVVLAEALLRGADAVLCANDVDDQLAQIVALVARGYAAANGARARSLLRTVSTRAVRTPAVRSELTPRELDILSSVAQGHSVRQTASSLGISIKTVENTQARLFRKLGVRNRAEALVVAYDFGLLPVE